MATYLVSYDLNKETTRPKIVDKIRTYGYARLSESSYVITTLLNENQVFADFSQLLDSNDYLFVVPVKKPYRGFGLKEVIQWLDNNLSY